MPDEMPPPQDTPSSWVRPDTGRSDDWLLWVVLGVICSSIVVFFGGPLVFRARKKADLTEAISNARQIGLAMNEFEKEYGTYPNATTAPQVKQATETLLTLSDHTSNDIFTQLFAAGMTQSEKMFYAKARSAKKPDDDIHSDATALEHGETSFAVIVGVSSEGDPNTPLAFGPVTPGTKALDTKYTDGKAVVLRVDTSVLTYKVDSNGHIIDHGMDLLDPRQPYWHGKKPDVRWPK